MTRFFLPTLLLAAFIPASMPAAPAAAPVSVQGAWTLHGSVSDVAFAATCNFVQKDNVLTGNCADETTSHKLTGKVHGASVEFSHDSTYNDDAITVNYSGKVGKDGVFTGDVDVEPYGSMGTFTATRVVESPAKGAAASQ